jgi:hypothetical protein
MRRAIQWQSWAVPPLKMNAMRFSSIPYVVGFPLSPPCVIALYGLWGMGRLQRNLLQSCLPPNNR